MILKHLWSFCKSPYYTPYPRLSGSLKLKIVSSLVFWNLLFGVCLALVAEGVFSRFDLDAGRHMTEDLFRKLSIFQVFFLMVLIAPVVEEIIFRGPLIFFRKSPYFPFAFYLSCIVFGMVHLGNFEESSSLTPWAPLLVAPQTLMACFLGFLRVKLGLIYAVLMHMGHNGLLFLLLALNGMP